MIKNDFYYYYIIYYTLYTIVFTKLFRNYFLENINSQNHFRKSFFFIKTKQKNSPAWPERFPVAIPANFQLAFPAVPGRFEICD